MEKRGKLLLFVVFGLLLILPLISAEWWDENWGYKKEITFIGAVPLNYSYNFLIQKEPSMSLNYGDLRFLNNSESGELAYWIKSYDSSSVNISIKFTGNDSIFVYYGNDLIENNSNHLPFIPTESINFLANGVKNTTDWERAWWYYCPQDGHSSNAGYNWSVANGTIDKVYQDIRGVQATTYTAHAIIKFYYGDGTNATNTSQEIQNTVYQRYTFTNPNPTKKVKSICAASSGGNKDITYWRGMIFNVTYNVTAIIGQEETFQPSYENAIFANANITEDLTVGGDIFALQSFFNYIGSAISRIVKGWFNEIDAISITTKNFKVNDMLVCLEDGTNCPPYEGLNYLSFLINVDDSITKINYGSLSGTRKFDIHENRVQNVIPTDCLVKNLYVDVSSNTRSTSSIVNFRINGANGNISLIIPKNDIGVFSDTTNADNVNAGDLVNYEIIRGKGSGSTTIRSIAIMCEVQ
ncbi:hypothetical protein KAR52_00855 [Candidatus Pacearchaeota archaeon]|nr:hypothetical protein [Candidatus Pacearchaeota archaeon]